MSAIAAENVSKHWTTADGEVRAVDRLSFAFDEGTLNVLLGPSGCGKSTTLRLIAGLEPADGGRILDRRARRHGPAAVAAQHRDGVPELRAVSASVGRREHRVRAQGAQGRAGGRRAAPAARSRTCSGSRELLDRKPSQLSGGQQQRVALGRAIIAEAPVCLMDEPLSNLDAQLRQDMRAEIRHLQRQLGITMVYVTHDQVEAMSMADRVVLLNRGRIEQNATPVELYERPANTFVARFIGTPPMNLLPLERGADGAVDRRHRRPGGRAGRLRRADARRAARAHRARLRARRRARRSRRSSIWAPIRSSPAGSARRRSPCAFPAASASRAATRRGSRGRPARSTCSSATARVAPTPLTSRNRDACSRSVIRVPPEEEAMLQKVHPRASPALVAALALAAVPPRRAQAPVEVSFYLPGRRRRPDHQDHRRLRRRLREGESRGSRSSRSTPAPTRTRSPRR